MGQPIMPFCLFSMEEMKNNKMAAAILHASLLAYAAFAAYLLHVNQEVLYTAHDRSEFVVGAPFFHALISKPFGLMQYVGAWLTQLFCHPALGAAVLVAIWALIFVVGAKAFGLRRHAMALMLLPLACLLTALVDLGYWIYIFNIKGYWFSQSVAYLLMLLLLWAARATPRKWHPVWYLAGFFLYPLLGWMALLFILCLALSGKPSWREVQALLVLIFTASIWRGLLYAEQNIDEVMMAGMPRFQTPVDSSMLPAVPFWVLGAVTALIALGGRSLGKVRGKCGTAVKWLVPVLSLAAAVIFTLSLRFHDRNYIDEMRMVRHATADNWREVLRVAEESKEPTTTMVMLKNVALMNEGGLLDRSFELGNSGTMIHKPDSLHVGLLDIASPLVCYNYGMMNEAIRLCYENAVSTGFSPFYMKILARCAQATGEEQLERRFITLLRRLPFYGDWQPAALSEKVGELQKCLPDTIYGVESNTERYVVNNLSLLIDSDSKVVSEQALFYAMMRCDSGRFWAALRNYVRLHPNESFPVHAQEAYIMYMDKAPEEKRMMLPVEQEVYDRYKQFWASLEGLLKSGVKQEEISSRMHGQWGGTYWWYNIFGRK